MVAINPSHECRQPAQETNMTAAQLAHLAELAASAADFFATTDPDMARVFAHAAVNADACSGAMRRAQHSARRSIDLAVNPTTVSSGVSL
jgi:hypothetical protein